MTKQEYQIRRVAKGLCANCGCRPLKVGCKWCIHCLREKARTYLDLKAQRKSVGKCPECNRKRVLGRWACKKHLRMRREATRRWSRKNRI